MLAARKLHLNFSVFNFKRRRTPGASQPRSQYEDSMLLHLHQKIHILDKSKDPEQQWQPDRMWRTLRDFTTSMLLVRFRGRGGAPSTSE